MNIAMVETPLDTAPPHHTPRRLKVIQVEPQGGIELLLWGALGCILLVVVAAAGVL